MISFGTLVVKMLVHRAPGQSSAPVSDASFLLMPALGGSRWWCKFLPPKRETRIEFPAPVWLCPIPAIADFWGVGQWVEAFSFSSFCTCTKFTGDADCLGPPPGESAASKPLDFAKKQINRRGFSSQKPYC